MAKDSPVKHAIRVVGDKMFCLAIHRRDLIVELAVVDREIECWGPAFEEIIAVDDKAKEPDDG